MAIPLPQMLSLRSVDPGNFIQIIGLLGDAQVILHDLQCAALQVQYEISLIEVVILKFTERLCCLHTLSLDFFRVLYLYLLFFFRLILQGLNTLKHSYCEEIVWVHLDVYLLPLLGIFRFYLQTFKAFEPLMILTAH